MKSVKFTLANYRYQELVMDAIGFTLLEQMCADLPEGKEKLGIFIDEVLADLKAGPVSPSGSNANSYSLPYKNVTSTLMQGASPLRERSPPSFWDGMAVGLLGSVMDCYLPSKPLQSYYGMRCGMGRVTSIKHDNNSFLFLVIFSAEMDLAAQRDGCSILF
ncbi:hypothetical protein TraAM80_02444 [Trypanosoma rangeli]|uniref:Uncharacterized protein n=1 Tax=Trypanosoma rangeli TaxID=5698 RepID=A0A422NTX0_TRYRA|nr:uncharacterized protein TraAM80_02444 [Trypanosoma rangeli]RNF08899.1 hypothetical protein TraAM80_02444 [Trypanosoma rangeli]|eukprot:RNF08899.1 hypothetical protein TraAM80_02444 [Trypanosoma rangeli]